MDLTVIILNFNVRYLLESCLESVLTAVQSISSEVIVVDNASSDESVTMIRSRFPQVILLTNAENLGFAKANNQAIARARGRNILILNPDTIVNTSAVEESLACLTRSEQVAAIGVKMTDGHGKFLKESKRGFPTLWASWWKLTGINRWFPQNPTLNHYYLGHLDPNGAHEVEVLTGAFLMIKKKVLESIGGFDEGYFMYGEDIDLSHRIRAMGYKLIYLGTQSIVHLKGRSSSAHSYQHVRNFYQAMLVFVKKYYRQPLTRTFMLMGIWLAGIFSWIKRKFFFHLLPLTDLMLIAGSIVVVQYFWSRYWFEDASYFHHARFFWNAAGYIIIWGLSLFVTGAYQTRQSTPAYLGFKAILSGTVVILVLYSLLPENWRTSRAIILLSGLVLSFIIPLSRILLKPRGFGFRALLYGDEKDELKLNALFRSLCHNNYFAYVSRLKPPEPGQSTQRDMDLFHEETNRQNITHVILARNPYWKTSLLRMTRQYKAHLMYMVEAMEFKEHLSHPGPIPGLSEAGIRLNEPLYQWSKDVLSVLTTLLVLPWGWVIPEIRKHFLRLATGRLQWVSYCSPADVDLPYQKPGLWNPVSAFGTEAEAISEINFEYAKNYHPFHDIGIILANLFKTS